MYRYAYSAALVVAPLIVIASMGGCSNNENDCKSLGAAAEKLDNAATFVEGMKAGLVVLAIGGFAGFGGGLAGVDFLDVGRDFMELIVGEVFEFV